MDNFLTLFRYFYTKTSRAGDKGDLKQNKILNTMATRRPRVKAAAILKPRRAQTTAIEQNSSETIKSEFKSNDEQQSKSIEPINLTHSESIEQLSIVNNKSTLSKTHRISETSDTTDNNDIRWDSMENKPPESSDTKLNISVVSPIVSAPPKQSFRRISTPNLNIANRRKSLIANENRPIGIGSPSYSHGYDSKSKQTKLNASPHVNRINAVEDEVFSPAAPDNDECFKSPPFMSPSIYSRRVDASMSPFHDIYNEDFAKSPSSIHSNTKIRQRIRPTPCFASRRNSIQGSNIGAAGFESEDEQRRQRHYSTSSSHSNYNIAATPHHQRNFFGLNKQHSRVRTESYSSSVSDVPHMRDLNSKIRRSHRSEEYQRVANAKREFNQKLNGKPPDKSRLTMYDLIYYNPLTNPMSKPAGKGDKNFDSASLSSVKTNQSRSSGSIKSESSAGGAGAATVKIEQKQGDYNSSPEKLPTKKEGERFALSAPVPQLKLGANGEIVLDEKSLVIETTGEKEAREILANSDVVYDDEFSGSK